MEIKTELRRLHDSGLNIYSLMYHLKKKKKWKKDRDIPNEVILAVTTYYWEHIDNIPNSWQWFMKALDEATQAYYANREVGSKNNTVSTNPEIRELINSALGRRSG